MITDEVRIDIKRAHIVHDHRHAHAVIFSSEDVFQERSFARTCDHGMGS